jgi:hypothetical protein
MPPRELEIAMRRLNEQPARDADRSERGQRSAEAGAHRLSTTPRNLWTRALVAQCIDGYIDSIIYDRKNWRNYTDFAGFLIQHRSEWNLPQQVAGGLVKDARELLRNARQLCTDSRGLQQIAALEKQLQ